jgi:hypothetical protein
MILLPTLRALATGSASAWQVTARREGQRLAMVVATPQRDEAARDALQSLDTATLRDRLVAVHGDDSQLLLDAEHMQLKLDVPLRHDDQSTDR